MSSQTTVEPAPANARSLFPTGKAINFIAYGPPEAMAAPDGEIVTARPQVYVRWFDAIKIADIKNGGRNNTDTVAITFDPESVGFTNAFSAYMNPSDPAVATLRRAFETGSTVTVAIESVRRAKAKKSGDPISKQIPINALRGAKEDGSDASMEASGDTIRNVIAFVDGQLTETLTSDPAEWKFLAKNRSGDLAPQGWRAVRDKDDWTKIGYVMQSGAQPSGGALSEDVIDSIVVGVVEGLAAQMALTSGGIESADIAREVRKGVFNEGKPWHTRTSNGMVNLGGYLLAKERATFITAMRIVGDAKEAQELSRRLLCIADRVQEETYGHGIKANRLAPSHKEAGLWVEFVVDHLAPTDPYPLYEIPAESDAQRRTAERDAWCAKIAAGAVELFRAAQQGASAYLQSASPSQQREPRAEGTTQTEALRGSSAPEGPSEAQQQAVRGLAAAVMGAWQDNLALMALQAQVSDRNMGQAPVAMQEDSGKVIVRAAFDVAVQEGWKSGPVGALLEYRIGALRASGESQSQHEPATAPSEQGPAAQPDAAPETAPDPVPSSGEYSPAVGALITQLQAAQTLTDLQAAFITARDGDLLDETVYIRPKNDATIEYGAREAKGYLALTVSAVLERLMTQAGTVAAEPTPAEATPAPQAASTNAEETSDTATAPTAEDEGLPEDGPTDPKAQEYADKAAALIEGTDLEAVEQLIREVKEKGLAEVLISVGELDGDLMPFLYHVRSQIMANS